MSMHEAKQMLSVLTRSGRSSKHGANFGDASTLKVKSLRLNKKKSK